MSPGRFSASTPKFSWRAGIEALVILSVYVFFLAGGIFGLQPALDIELLYPPEGAQAVSSPIALGARISSRGKPMSANVTFSVSQHLPDSALRLLRYTSVADERGIVTVQFSVRVPSHCTWYAVAEREGYVPATSEARSFDIEG